MFKKFTRRESNINIYQKEEECRYPIYCPETSFPSERRHSTIVQTIVPGRRLASAEPSFGATNTSSSSEGLTKGNSQPISPKHQGGGHEIFLKSASSKRRPSLPVKFFKKFKPKTTNMPLFQQEEEHSYPIFSPVDSPGPDRKPSLPGQFSGRRKSSLSPTSDLSSVSDTSYVETMKTSLIELPGQILKEEGEFDVHTQDEVVPVPEEREVEPCVEEDKQDIEEEEEVQGKPDPPQEDVLNHPEATAEVGEERREEELEEEEETEAIAPLQNQQNKKPSFAELQQEDLRRRPSVTVYQLEDSDHPDIVQIQALVEKLNW